MHKNVRRSVFETNSSSTHSISIENDSVEEFYCYSLSILMAEVYPLMGIHDLDEANIWQYTQKYHRFTKSDAGNVVFLTGGEYGFGYSKLSSPIDKLNYIFTYIITTSEKDRILDDERYQLIQKIVFDRTGNKIAPDVFEIDTFGPDRNFYEKEIIYFCKNGSLDGFKYVYEYYDDNEETLTETAYHGSNIYIDHQSIHLLDPYFEDNDEELAEDKLKELIFNPTYKIVIDNDNH